MTGEPAGSLISEPEAAGYLKRYGIAYPEYGVAACADEAAQIADRLGYPVVLKVISPDVIHKSDAGGVEVGLATRQAVETGYGRILNAVWRALPQANLSGILVCRQAPPGLEVIVGGLHDPMFGPAIMFGLGGIFAEVLRDVTFRVVPISLRDAQAMLREIKGYPLLVGARNRPALDREALAELLVQVSRLMEENPEIEDLDLNPVRVYEKGVTVLDARILRRAGA